jgi:signal transduction histidine kinase
MTWEVALNTRYTRAPITHDAAVAQLEGLEREQRVAAALLEIESLDPSSVLDRICQLTVDLMPCDRATAYLYTNRARGFLPIADCGTPPHIYQRFANQMFFGQSHAGGRRTIVPFRDELAAGRIGHTSRAAAPPPEALALLDELELFAMCIVPFSSNARGALFVSLNGPPDFDATALRIVQAVAHQASNLVGHARTFQKLQHAARIRAGLATLATALNRETDSHRIAELLSAEVVALFRLSCAAVLVPQARGLVVLGAHGLAERDVWIPLRDDTAVLGDAMQSGTSVFQNDLDESAMSGGPLCRELGLKSVLGLPLVGRDGPLGCLLLGNTKSRNGFSVEIADEAMVLGPLASAALERAALFQADAARKRELARARDQALSATRLKTEFLANMSHEIRTPMSAVIGMTELLVETPLSEEQRDFVTTIRRSAHGLLNLINDILDVSKIEAGKLTIEHLDFSLHQLLEDAVEMFVARAAEKHLALSCVIRPGLPDRLRSDPHRLHQVLTNLLGNAIKFTERGGVALEAELLDESASCARVRLIVRDTGIGIATERQQAVFESFTQADGSTTRRYGGSGLGLTISRQLIEIMGGRMHLESAPGKGSAFWIEIAFEKTATAVSA